MVNRTKVMVVDGLTETEEVLKAVLEPRGMQVTRVRTGLPTADAHPNECPTVIVLHESDRSCSNDSIVLSTLRSWDEVPRVVIGHGDHRTSPSSRLFRYLSQPFQYAELVTAIESLVQPEPAV